MRYKKSFKELSMAALARLLIGLLTGSLTGYWIAGVGAPSTTTKTNNNPQPTNPQPVELNPWQA